MVKKIMNTKSQTWSLDLMLGVAIFLALAVIFVFLLFTQTDEFLLREDADKIYSQFDLRTNPDGLGLFEGGSISREALEKLFIETQYDQIRNELGITGEFCIVLVDNTDGLIKIGDKYGFGSGEDIEISEGIFCGDAV